MPSINPEVAGISCHRVIPRAPKVGVIDMAIVAMRAVFFLNRHNPRVVNEKEKSCEKKKVANSGCFPPNEMKKTKIPQTCVYSLVILFATDLLIIPSESGAKKPGLNTSHQMKTMKELTKYRLINPL